MEGRERTRKRRKGEGNMEGGRDRRVEEKVDAQIVHVCCICNILSYSLCSPTLFNDSLVTPVFSK